MKKEDALKMLLEVLLEKRDFKGNFLSLQAWDFHRRILRGYSQCCTAKLWRNFAVKY